MCPEKLEGATIGTIVIWPEISISSSGKILALKLGGVEK